jgi:protein-S-isoprenylcysteine O-methyltransferase Ste14
MKAMHALELRIPPALVWFLAAGAIFACARGFPAGRSELPARHAVAVGCALAGLALALAGVREFRRAQTTVNPLEPGRARSIVSSGVYRHTRNPMYLGMALGLVGWALWTGSLAGLVVVPVFMSYLTLFQIIPEERALLARFGSAYADYCVQVRRWL